MPTFELFEGRSTKPAAQPRVSLQRKGLFSLNEAAYRLLGAPHSVLVFYARNERIVGFQAAPEGAPKSYPLRKSGSQSWLVAAKAFAQYYGIPLDTSRRYSARMEDSMLVIDLNEADEAPAEAEDERAHTTA